MENMPASVLSSADGDALLALIDEQRQQTRAQVDALTRQFEDIIEAVELTNNDDEHDPEGTTIAFERAQVIALLEQAKADLAALDHASVRLADGTYGVCVGCSGAIGIERLTALPATLRCVRCA